jgi:hypothetical protein
MASTVNVMTYHANGKVVSCAVDMASVNVGNVSVMQAGLVRPAIVYFLQRTVKLMKGVRPAPIMVTASVVLVTAV